MIRHITKDLEISSDDFDTSDKEKIKRLGSFLKKVSLCVQKAFLKMNIGYLSIKRERKGMVYIF